MKKFISPDFLLNTETGRQLYHNYAADLPIIDYHCHLPPKEIAENHTFRKYDRSLASGEIIISGVPCASMESMNLLLRVRKSDWEKFLKWSETVPYTLRNPLYHWTHLELQRYFDIDKILNE